jgi:hypothetical protein
VSWLRLDDKFAEHPKVVALTDREFRLHVKVMCYCARYQTGGRIPPKIGSELAGITPRFRARMTSLGLWESDPDGTLKVHDFDSWNPGDPHGAERAKRYRDRQKHRDGDRDADRDASSRARAGAQAQPIPSLLTSLSSVVRDVERDDDDFQLLKRQWTHYARTTPGIRNPEAYAYAGTQTGHPPPQTTDRTDNLERYVRTVAWQYEPASLAEDLTERGATEEQIAELSAIAQQVREAERAATRASELDDSERESADDGGMRDAGG